jgi:NADH-ubiquinone oxidoreductase chain 2
MLVLYIFILMFTNSINHFKKNIHSTFINRISIIAILMSIFLVINVLNFQSIGKGISIYSGLFQITIQSQIIEVLLLIVGICILTS